MCGNSVRLFKTKGNKLKDTQLHLFMRKKCHFFDVGDSFGTIQTQSKNEIDIPCTDKACILNFSSYKKLEKNLNFGHHKFEVESQTQLSKVADKWVRRFHQSIPHSIEKQMPSLSSNMTCSTSGLKHHLKKGWGIPGRVQRWQTDTQKRLLKKIYDDGKKSGNKLSAVQTEKQLKKTLTPDEYLPVATIKSYFSRKTQLIKQGKIVDDSVKEDDEDTESDEEKEEGSSFESELVEDERIEKERSHLITVISVAVSRVNVVKDEWITVAYDRDWYPGQFVKFDEEQEEMQRHFVHRSSSNHYWFVWPELSNDVPDISWVNEGE